MTLSFANKARTLAQLEGRLSHAVVLPQVRFNAATWQRAPVLPAGDADAVAGWLANSGVIVRSSAAAEDREGGSLAGHFTSVGGVRDQAGLSEAIRTVVESFGATGEQDEVFIQPMLSDVVAAGVAFTRDPSSGGHYWVINYDDVSGQTDTVTGGAADNTRTLLLSKWHRPDLAQLPPWVEGLVAMLAELCELFGRDNLDVEFAVDRDGRLCLLQVRPLNIADGVESIGADQHRDTLDRIASKIRCLSAEHPYLCGKRSVYGVMPDWNPAEIVGVRPRPLALSLYKELVTDAIWAYQRDNYGYRNLRSFPLLISFAGLPYIDVRVSFNSFVPADLDEALADRLVNYYIDRLEERPSHHDKVEFEIIQSCYTLDLEQRLERLGEHGFRVDERERLSASLRDLTNRIIHGESGLWKKDIEKIEKLRERQALLQGAELDPIAKAYWLLEDCKRYGTLPFAGLARAGFIAVQMLQSMIRVGVLSQDDYEAFMRSLETVSSAMAHDLVSQTRGAFLEVYGHLRPGTYDILSQRYDESPERYFGGGAQAEAAVAEEGAFSLTLEQMNRLSALLEQHQLDHDVISLFNFIKSAIEGRELAKFVFTRSLSDVLVLLEAIGRRHGFSRQDMSYADVNVVRQLYMSADDPARVLGTAIAQGRETFRETRSLVLPPLITRAEDVYAFAMPEQEPNFVTLKRVQAPVTAKLDEGVALEGQILFIPSADPGFDWIFTHNIAGFVTQYGGSNSHMAIRAAELGIPAVIGAGAEYYQQWSRAQLLELDCANRKVQRIR
jgi:phosphohistidine swiveling domain-containing protein